MATEHISLRIEAKLLARLRKAAASAYGPTQSKLISRGIELALDELKAHGPVGHARFLAKDGRAKDA